MFQLFLSFYYASVCIKVWSCFFHNFFLNVAKSYILKNLFWSFLIAQIILELILYGEGARSPWTRSPLDKIPLWKDPPRKRSSQEKIPPDKIPLARSIFLKKAMYKPISIDIKTWQMKKKIETPLCQSSFIIRF